MRIQRIIQKIGEVGALASMLLALGGGASSLAADAQFTAQVDRARIGQDDSVSLRFSVQAEGNVSTTPPVYEAPDFQEINSYDSSFVESYYDSANGRISVRNNQTLTKVLRPMKTGQLRISHISVTVNGKVKSVPDIVVEVGPAGSGTPPPHHYGGSGVGLRGAVKQPMGKNTIFLRAEVDKDKVYKGEQVVVSYYLYRRVRVLNAQVDKFPMLNGFLREELEMPVMQPRLDVESVVLDGVPYQRSLLARYAAYPLQEGKLQIDSMKLKYNYYAGAGVTDDGEDPFLQFFRQMSPREGIAKSDPISVQVTPLPAEGRPASFSGGVGEFNVSSAVDKYEVRANEAVTLTVKVEGRGNVAAIGEPKAKWPENVELYDSKGSAKSGKAGVGEKNFEILLIPRVPGKVVLPGLEFSFFDPARKQYVTRTTDPISITVSEAAPGSSAPRPLNAAPVASTSASPAPQAGLRDLKPPTGSSEKWTGIPSWRWMYLLAVASLGIFAVWVLVDAIQGLRKKKRETARIRAQAFEKSWERIRSDARSAEKAPWTDVLATYDRLGENVLEAIDRGFSIGAKSLSRSEIRRILVEEKGFDASQWDPIDRLLEFSEMIRFAGAASVSLESRARAELTNWVSHAENAVRALEQFSGK